MTKPLTIFTTLMLFSCVTYSTSKLHANAESYIQEACNVTRYQDLCIKSLASYSNKAKQSPIRWARAGVSVTIGEVESMSRYLNYLKGHRHVGRSRNRGALFDCVECIQDTLNNLHKSLRMLTRLSISHFNAQMNDVVTWLSVALTDEDTCISGFEGRHGKQITRLCSKVQNAIYITSNALALANKLATAGLHYAGDEP